MRVILFSDLQLSSYETYSRLTKEGINDRLVDHINVLNQIKDYAVENKIKNILFLGDGFDSRGKIGVIAANLFLNWKKEISDLGINQYDLIGNHDLVAKSHSHNSLELFSHIPNVKVIDKAQWIHIGEGSYVYFIPYMHRTDQIKEALDNCKPPTNISKKKSFALMHYGLFDTEINGRVIVEDKGTNAEGQVRLTDLDKILDYVSNVFLGHYHTHASYNGNVHYVGTPLQHNWGEAGLPGRFIVLDTDNDTFEAVHTKAPRFIDFSNSVALNKKLIEGNFCRYTVKNLQEKEEITKIFLDNGARAADVLVIPKTNKIESKTNLNMGMTFKDMGYKLLDTDNIITYDRKVLEQIMLNALDFAESKVVN